MHPHLRHGHPAVLGSNRLLWKRFPHTGGRLYIWLPWPQGRLCWLGVTAVGLLIVADAVCVLTWFQERGLESRIEADDQRSCPSPSSVARDRDSPRKALSDAASRGGRAFLLERLSVRLVLDPDAGAAGALQAGQRTWRRVRASFEDAPGDLAPCPSLASSLTLWAAIVAAGDEQDEQLVERADVEPEDAECAWRVSFTPRESRAYDLHVRAFWVNATAEPAYGTCDDVAGKGWCLSGRRLVQREGAYQAGQEEVNLTGSPQPVKFCCDLCAGDERCHAWSLQQPPGGGAACTLLGPGSSRAPGNCTSGVPRSDADSWRYLGGWSILQTSVKDELRHAQSHVSGAAGGGPGRPELSALWAACGAGGPGPGACEYGRRPGRWRFAGRAPNWTADWEPDAGKLPAYTRDEVGRCWQSRGITKIAMTGDSLIREQFNGLRSYVEENFEVKKVSNAHFWWRRPDGVDVSVEFIDFFSFFREISMLQYAYSWRRKISFTINDALNAQVLITNFNAVWQLWFESDCVIERRLHRFVDAVQALAQKSQQRVFISGVYTHSLRQSYIFPPRMERLNGLAQRLLGSAGFQTLDAYNTSKLAGNVSADGMHLHGPVAPVLTRVLIGMLCDGGSAE